MPEERTDQPEASSYKYWAFISYSHRDKAWGDWLHRSIETSKVPPRLAGRAAREGVVPKRLFPVFRDSDELPTSGNLGDNIREALRGSRYLIVICSPASAASRWVDQTTRCLPSGPSRSPRTRGRGRTERSTRGSRC